jgi:hypothetical protein
MIEIGWTPYKYSDYEKSPYEMEFIDNVYFEPEKLSNFYENTKSLFKLCPANTQFLKNFWVIKSPFDLTLNINRKEKTCYINQNQRFFNTFVSMRWNQFTETDLALCSFNFCYLFVSDKPVMIEVYPAFLHEQVKNTRFINGSFNIYKWQRPVDFSFEILNDNEPVEIKREQPLFYVKFLSNNIEENFKLKNIEWTDELLKLNKKTQIANWVKGLSWKLLKIGNKGRPKKLVK